MKKVIELLKESGTIEKIQKSINSAGGMTGEVPQEIIDGAVGNIIIMEMNHNEELEDAVIDYAMNKAIGDIVNELGIKFQPDSKEAHEKPLSVQLLETILKTILD